MNTERICVPKVIWVNNLDFIIKLSYRMNNTSDKTVSGNNLIDDIRSDDHYYRSIIENNSFYVIKTDLEGKY